jgi:hypothetical protein
VIVLSFCAHISCGYRAVYGGESPVKLHVKVVRALVPDAVASDEVANGVREELALEGALEPGEGWPCAEIEVLRADEASEGIAVAGGGPLARGMDVGLVGRAWVAPSADASHQRDTGDMRAAGIATIDESAGAPDPRQTGFHHADALRAAGRRLGHKLARRLLGHPVTTEDAIDP